MAESDFVQINSCANAAEAEQIRGILEGQGIPAFLDGANTNTTLWHVGTALGGVRVFVRSADADRAMQIVESARGSYGASSAPWYCGNCHETNEPAFDLCWSCGNARSDVERPFPPAASDVDQEAEKAEDGANVPAADTVGYDESNPYASPRAAARVPAAREPAGEISEEAEAMLQRAWRASIIGLVFLPVVLQLYSMYLLLRAAATTDVFSAVGQKRFYYAFGVNLLAGAFWCMILRLMFG